MIKIAFIKFGGMANGGTEKYLQTIASHLPKDEFEVDFFIVIQHHILVQTLFIQIQMHQGVNIVNLMV